MSPLALEILLLLLGVVISGTGEGCLARVSTVASSGLLEGVMSAVAVLLKSTKAVEVLTVLMMAISVTVRGISLPLKTASEVRVYMKMALSVIGGSLLSALLIAVVVSVRPSDEEEGLSYVAESPAAVREEELCL